MPSAQMRRAGECQPRVLERNHGRKQDKDLIEEHARQQLAIAKPVDVADLEGREPSRRSTRKTALRHERRPSGLPTRGPKAATKGKWNPRRAYPIAPRDDSPDT